MLHGFHICYPANISVHNGAKESIGREMEIAAAAVGRAEASGSGQRGEDCEINTSGGLR